MRIDATLIGSEDLPTAKRIALATVKNLTARVRAKYVTDLPGQEAVYQAKLDEANAFIIQGKADEPPTAYPYLNSEAKSKMISLYEAAALIRRKSTEAKTAVMLSEQYRTAANHNIETAQTFEAVKRFIEIFRLQAANL